MEWHKGVRTAQLDMTGHEGSKQEEALFTQIKVELLFCIYVLEHYMKNLL